MARRIGSGVRNDGSPQANDAASPTLALNIAISLMAEILPSRARVETQHPSQRFSMSMLVLILGLRLIVSSGASKRGIDARRLKARSP
jgi:hypothetical protein